MWFFVICGPQIYFWRSKNAFNCKITTKMATIYTRSAVKPNSYNQQLKKFHQNRDQSKSDNKKNLFLLEILIAINKILNVFNQKATTSKKRWNIKWKSIFQKIFSHFYFRFHYYLVCYLITIEFLWAITVWWALNNDFANLNGSNWILSRKIVLWFKGNSKRTVIK